MCVRVDVSDISFALFSTNGNNNRSAFSSIQLEMDDGVVVMFALMQRIHHTMPK